ncbi:poly adp-ribose polymerase family member parp [Anaeramoeba ignava]|uniref:Poly [ADP-ribose] polymerase n=1 Tax=Anaeramoeba ignava TaxID=1746090 RepID=A0A9Q0LCQ2_ANAIG|nr:poly adp-ribose polymerase family member parp [Anaeramoeba ignava]
MSDFDTQIKESKKLCDQYGIKTIWEELESCFYYSIRIKDQIQKLFSFISIDSEKDGIMLVTQSNNPEIKSVVDEVNKKKRKRLIDVTNDLIEILKKKFNIKEVEKKPEKKESSDEDDEDDDDDDEDDDDDDEIVDSDDSTSDDMQSHLSMGLGLDNSKYMDLLKQDLKEATDYIGNEKIDYYAPLNSLKIQTDVSFLSSLYADALGIDPSLPITLVIDFSKDYTTSVTPPLFEIWQIKGKSFGLQFQLKEIIIAYLKKHWKHYGNIAKGIADEPNNQNIHLETTTQEKKKSGIMGHFFSKNKKKEKIDIDMKKVQSLVEMGFSEEAVVGVLIMTKNDASKASSLLIEGGHEDFIKIAHEYGFKSAQVKSKNSNKKFKRNFAVEVDIDTFIPSTNLIIDLFDYMNQRVKNCTNYCIICGKKLGSEGLKPVCCEDPACIFRHQQMGLGANVSSEIEQQPDLVDLLITMAVTACYSSRNDLIFDPFPTDFLDPTTKAKKFDELKKVLDSFPSVDEMSKFGRDERKLRGYLESLHPESYRLLRWLITTNRAHLIKLEESQQITEFNTKNQFLLLSGPPQKESAFQELKKNNPSVYAFHGSPVENWHCILRTGLKNMSNTKRMMHAAAYGAGIYLAAEPSTSTYYGRSGTGWKKSRFSNSSFQCMALCEIVKTSEVKNPNPFYVIPNEDLVMTRCFFVNFGSVSSVNTTKLKEVVPTMFSSVSKTKK